MSVKAQPPYGDSKGEKREPGLPGIRGILPGQILYFNYM